MSIITVTFKTQEKCYEQKYLKNKWNIRFRS